MQSRGCMRQPLRFFQRALPECTASVPKPTYILSYAFTIFLVMVITSIALASERIPDIKLKFPVDTKIIARVKFGYLPQKDEKSQTTGKSGRLSALEKEALKYALRIIKNEYEGKYQELKIGWYDINNDGTPDMFIKFSSFYACGAQDRCPVHILVSQKNGQWKDLYQLNSVDPPFILSSKHLNYNDLYVEYENAQFDSYSSAFIRFNGVRYSCLYHVDYKRVKDRSVEYTLTRPYFGKNYLTERLINIE
jgi:hypothetical protein